MNVKHLFFLVSNLYFLWFGNNSIVTVLIFPSITVVLELDYFMKAA